MKIIIIDNHVLTPKNASDMSIFIGVSPEDELILMIMIIKIKTDMTIHIKAFLFFIILDDPFSTFD